MGPMKCNLPILLVFLTQDCLFVAAACSGERASKKENKQKSESEFDRSFSILIREASHSHQAFMEAS